MAASNQTRVGDRILGRVEVPAEAFFDPTKEIEIDTVEWRSALDIYLVGGDSTGSVLALSATTRVYASCRGTQAKISQNCFVPPVGRWTNGNPPDPAIFSWPLARVRSYGGEQLRITMQSSAKISGGSQAFYAGKKVQISYCAYGREPAAEVEPPVITWPSLNGYGSQFTVLPGAGRVHNLWVVNSDAIDRWVMLFDDGPQRPAYTGTIASIANSSNTGFLSAPIYVPPNGKGAAFLEYGTPNGLQPRYGAILLASASDALPFVFDVTANVTVLSRVS